MLDAMIGLAAGFTMSINCIKSQATFQIRSSTPTSSGVRGLSHTNSVLVTKKQATHVQAPEIVLRVSPRAGAVPVYKPSICRLILRSRYSSSAMASSVLLIALSSIPTSYAWGSLGHETVAYIASHYVTDHTEQWAQGILDDTSTSYLANVATWADSYRYTTAGAFSSPFHYIDAEDNPPSSCSVDYDRDCGTKGCSVSAIANYTTRVQSSSLSDQEVNYALRFLVHFIGDITQPLHDEAYEVGGNDVDVTFDDTNTNLHHIWDSNMPEKLRGGYSLSDAQSWANDLITEIDSGDYESQKASWISGLDIEDAKGTALEWATDANTFVCSKVMPDGASALTSSADLYPTYYDGVIDTIQLQVAKAGYRLAKWLDAIAEKQTVRKMRRSVVHDEEEIIGHKDLSGEDLLPRRTTMSVAQRRREAMGYDCRH